MTTSSEINTVEGHTATQLRLPVTVGRVRLGEGLATDTLVSFI